MAVTFTSNTSATNGTKIGYYKMPDLEANPIVISTSGITVHGLEITGSSASEDGFVCLYDVNDAVTVGTTVPHAIFPFAVSGSFDIRIPAGMEFDNGLVAIIKSTAGTAGSSAISNAANLILITS